MSQPKVKDNLDPLVDLRTACPDIIIGLWSKRLKKEKTAYLRKTVVQKLNEAKSSLPKGLTFIIGDAWRSQATQEKILKRFERRFRKQFPNWSKEQILTEVNKYAAPAEGEEVSGHLTGGAVDLRIGYLDGRKVPLKSRKLSYQENSKSDQPLLPRYLQNNRKIMYRTLEKAGFVNVSNEFWHWSYGDLNWAHKTNQKFAIYGVVKAPIKTQR